MYLGIDCGTQGTKALLIDEDGRALGRGFAAHTLMERPNGAREQEPREWVDALRKAVKEAISQVPAADVVAIGVSGQQHGLVVLDGDKHVIRPAKLWNDTQTAPENATLIERLGGAQACFDRFGIVPLTGYTASKLLWMKKHEPDNFSKIRHILLPHDYLNFWMTGKIYAEYGDASGTGFFDVRKRSWAEEVLNEIDDGSGQLYRALPELLQPEQIVGTLRQDVAREFGLPVGCVVATGGGDNMMGAIGSGNVREGMVTLSLGTSATVYSYSDRPVVDASGNVAPFCSSSGGWLPLICTMNATNVVTQTLTLLGKTVADIEGALASTTPGAEGLCFLPFLNGERTPNLPTAQGSITGMSANNFTSANLMRAVIEGVSFGILSGLDMILDAKRPKEISLTGGGARSSQWRQLLADVTGVLIQVPAEIEAGCLGAAMQAMYAYSHKQGEPQSFVEIAERCVRVNDSKTAYPREEKRLVYHHALETYRRSLTDFYLVRL